VADASRQPAKASFCPNVLTLRFMTASLRRADRLAVLWGSAVILRLTLNVRLSERIDRTPATETSEELIQSAEFSTSPETNMPARSRLQAGTKFDSKHYYKITYVALNTR
ncbi:MAG TPA: hypothetical protein VL132_09530, partial [Planctomycetaceae bacterium]|nr:hypothetical protein [Planctomycetaceae bacterium]